MTQIKSIEIYKGYVEGADNTTSNCVSRTPFPQPTHAIALSPSSAVAKSEAIQTVAKCVFPPPPWNFGEILEQEFYSISTSWDIHDSAMADGCNIYNLFSNLVILQPMSMVMKRKYYY